MSDRPHEDRPLLDLVRQDGVVTSQVATLTPLSGGVSSEICLVEDAGQRFVVKRALRRLKVRDEWLADPRRNLHEQACLRYIGRILPGAVPVVLFASEAHGYFAMEHLPDEAFANWKQQLLAGHCRQKTVARAARILGSLHRHSRGDRALARQFDTLTDFTQLRIEPYLLTTAARHPALAPLFHAEAERLTETREALVHGDFSPKNILVGARRTVVLDCEVAWYGDPAFDVAFLLNHLLLKSLYHAVGPGCDLPRWNAAAELTLCTYRDALEDDVWADAIERRGTPLLLMLMLARVDGKSPVEYLDEPRRQFVRDFVSAHLPTPLAGMQELLALWFDTLGKR